MTHPASVMFEDIGQGLTAYFDQAEGPLYIVCPFITPDVLVRVLAGSGETEVVLLTSWRADHLLAGVSHLELYPLCQSHGWTLFINNRLHAKCYSDGLRSAWVGSANLTQRALGYVPHPNAELLCHLHPLPTEVRVAVYRMLAQSRLVSEELYDAYKNWLDSQDQQTVNHIDEPDFASQISVDPFLISELPASSSPTRLWECITGTGSSATEVELLAAEHDIVLYSVAPREGKEGFFETLRGAFLAHPFIRELTKFVTGDGQRFGAVKQWIQETCTTVPEPYRRELTEPVQHIYTWLKELAPDAFEVIVPGRRSQVLRYTGEPIRARTTALIEAPGDLNIAWRDAVRNLGVATFDGRPAPHKPLLTLLILSAAARHDPNSFPYERVESNLKSLLQEFGPLDGQASSLLPFWHLQSSGYWTVDGADKIPLGENDKRPHRETLIRRNATARVPQDLWACLVGDPSLQASLVDVLFECFLPTARREEICRAAGLPPSFF